MRKIGNLSFLNNKENVFLNNSSFERRISSKKILVDVSNNETSFDVGEISDETPFDVHETSDVTRDGILKKVESMINRINEKNNDDYEIKKLISRKNNKNLDILLRILNICHELITKEIKVTKRGIYYRDVGLFGSQNRVDRGKGYPDFATRHLIKLLSDLKSEIPILGFFDNDPYGIDILNVYKYGGPTKLFENKNWAISRLQWIGLHHIDREHNNISENLFIKLTSNDKKKSKDLLKKEYLPETWRNEIQEILNSNKKCEIESLCYDDNENLLNYLIAKVNNPTSWL
nr:7611_t:CDS:10 [Entrophospora candida]